MNPSLASLPSSPNRSLVTRHWSLLLIVIGQTLLCCSLAVSLCWNIWQASDASARVQEAYHVGLEDGEAQFRARLVRAIIAHQLIEEQQAKAEREKL